MYVVDYGEHSPNLTWAGPLSLDANGAGEDDGGGSEDWILRLSTNPSTPANVSLPVPVYPLARGGSTIYVNTTGRPHVRTVIIVSACLCTTMVCVFFKWVYNI